ncbi:hypothetical protein V5799_031739 [Amblyomma americanum]|uniref:Secreted protein n=1 Tax=Amblyomma americanum TaxID=6943 RepID=A0AAQ4DT64_AMBAM
MALKFTVFYVGGVLCIWLSGQVSSQDSGPCAPDEDMSCYLNYTQEILHAALGPDLEAYAQSGKKSDDLCSSLPQTSMCQQQRDDCSTNDADYQQREEAYVTQRDIFCRAENLQAYAEAAICITKQPGFNDCIQKISKTPTDSMEQSGYDCTVGEKRLECLDLHIPMCSHLKTGVVRRTYVNSQVLAGCVASMPQPESFSAGNGHA